MLVILFCTGIGMALSNTFHLSEDLIKSQAIEDLTLHAQALNQAVNLYSDAVVERAKNIQGITVTDGHAYLTKPGGIPLPSTFGIELGERIVNMWIMSAE